MKINPKNILILVVISAVLLLISLVINTKNHYNQNKETVLKDINTTFDNAVEYYYNEIAKHNFIAIVGKDSIDFKNLVKGNFLDSISPKNIKTVAVKNKPKSKVAVFAKEVKYVENKVDYKVFKGKKRVDSISRITSLTHKIIMSFRVDSIDFKAFTNHFNKELKRKNIDLQFQLKLNNDKKVIQETEKLKDSSNWITFKNNSTFLPNGTTLVMNFENPTSIILKKGIYNVVLSFVLMFFIVFLLGYMLWIIQKQKKIDEIKNDFISNITHELKTPITTIHAAIEGIKHFNDNNDVEKTNKYLDIAQHQNQKLNIIVEKILETASIDVNNLKLNFEIINISDLLEAIILEFSQNITYKTFNHKITPNIFAKIDAFHFENVINNIFDNAVKYGGETIDIELFKTDKISITIQDSGSIDSKEKELIFDKFYRIHQGNLHNNKGFGIGLYYAKKIVELHFGQLVLKSTKKTTFEITLPDYEK
jgi:signal transduction histidine kinase